MKRNVIHIDEERCTGCGLCVPDCPEGAIQIVEGKARLVKDALCDGLGACLGTCPEGAITIEEREAEAYDEAQAMENVIAQGPEAIHQHLEHLQHMGELELLAQARAILEKHQNTMPIQDSSPTPARHSACAGSAAFAFHHTPEARPAADFEAHSALSQWPIQMHLLSPHAPQFRGAHMVLAADCTAFSVGAFHARLLHGKTLGIACPKLDQGLEKYEEKLVHLIDEARIQSLTVVIMEVPCCSGLLRLARRALTRAHHKVPLRLVVVGVRGEILSTREVEHEPVGVQP